MKRLSQKIKIILVPTLLMSIMLSSALLFHPARVYAGSQNPAPADTQTSDLQEAKRPQDNLSNKSCSEKNKSNQSKSNLDPENCAITGYVLILINVLSATLGVAVTAVIIIAGIQYSASAGNPQATAAAKKRITNAALALVFFAAMYGFLQWIVPGGVL